MTVDQSVRQLGQIPACSIDDANRVDVVKICEALDGIPRLAS